MPVEEVPPPTDLGGSKEIHQPLCCSSQQRFSSYSRSSALDIDRNSMRPQHQEIFAMKAIVSTLLALSVLAGIASSAAAFDARTFYEQQDRTHS